MPQSRNRWSQGSPKGQQPDGCCCPANSGVSHHVQHAAMLQRQPLLLLLVNGRQSCQGDTQLIYKAQSSPVKPIKDVRESMKQQVTTSCTIQCYRATGSQCDTVTAIAAPSWQSSVSRCGAMAPNSPAQPHNERVGQHKATDPQAVQYTGGLISPDQAAGLHAWAALPQSTLRDLMLSMPKRLDGGN